MDGHTFVSNLKALGLTQAESLRENDFDWIFLSRSNQSFCQFWQSFFSNMSPDDVLRTEEIEEYKELLSSGSVLPSKRLAQMESYLQSVSFEEENEYQLELKTDETHDIEQLREDFKRLNYRKNFLSLQKMEVEGGLNERRQIVRRLQQGLESRKRSVQTISNEHSKAAENLYTSIQSVASRITPFTREGSKTCFVSQIPSTKWEEEEEKYKELLSQFVYRQFAEGIDRLAGQVDTSSYLLLDAGQIDLQFVRGPKQPDYLMNVKELNRVNKMLEETEVEAVEVELLNVQKNAEMEEATKVMRAVQAKTSLSPFALRQELATAQEMGDALQQDLDFEKTFLKEQVTIVAQMERLRVLSGNYEVKLRRQAYYIDKLRMVREFLLRRSARIDFLKMILVMEKHRIDAVVEVLSRLTLTLDTQSQNTQKRLDKLKVWKEFWLSGEATRAQKEVLEHLLTPFDQEHNDKAKSEKDIIRLVTHLDSALRISEAEGSAASDGELKCINQLYASCSLLEECLFGTGGRMECSLPPTWLGPPVAEQLNRVEEKVRTVQQDMLEVLRKLETNKKLLRDNPTLQRDLTKWTREYSNRKS